MRRFRSAVLASCLLGCAPSPAPAAEPIPPPPPVDLPPAAPLGEERPVELCILRDGEIATVPATYRPETGDTVVDGRPWREAYPATSPPYAAGVDWYVYGEMLPIEGRRHSLEKYGLPYFFAPTDLKRYGEYRGLPLFVEAEFPGGVPDVVYLFVRPGCEFQPYLQAYQVGGVRGR